MKQWFSRLFKALYVAFKIVFFIVVTLISVQLAQLEALQVLHIKKLHAVLQAKTPQIVSSQEMQLHMPGLLPIDRMHAYDELIWWQHPLWLVKQPYSELQEVLAQEYYPAIPLTVNALVYLGIGWILSLSIWGMLRFLVYVVVGGSKSAVSPPPSES